MMLFCLASLETFFACGWSFTKRRKEVFQVCHCNPATYNTAFFVCCSYTHRTAGRKCNGIWHYFEPEGLMLPTLSLPCVVMVLSVVSLSSTLECQCDFAVLLTWSQHFVYEYLSRVCFVCSSSHVTFGLPCYW